MRVRKKNQKLKFTTRLSPPRTNRETERAPIFVADPQEAEDRGSGEVQEHQVRVPHPLLPQPRPPSRPMLQGLPRPRGYE